MNEITHPSLKLKKLINKSEKIIKSKQLQPDEKKKIMGTYLFVTNKIQNIKQNTEKTILEYFENIFNSLKDDPKKTTKERNILQIKRNNLLKYMKYFFNDQYKSFENIKKNISDKIFFENKKKLASQFFSEDEVQNEQKFFEMEENKKTDKLPINKKSCRKVYSILKKDKKGNWDIIKNQIGDDSSVGKVFNACLGDDCDFIIKIVSVFRNSHVLWLPDIDKNSENYGEYKQTILTPQHMINEIEIQIKMSKYGLAPKILDAYYCLDFLKDLNTGEYIKTKIKNYNEKDKDTYFCKKSDCFIPIRTFYIVMEKYDITVNGFLKIFKNDPTDIFNVYLNVLKIKSHELLKKSHDLGIIHGDSHIANFMFNFTKKGKSTIDKFQKEIITSQYILENDINKDFFGSFQNLVMIDFGLSINKISEKLISNDKKNIDQTFIKKYIY